MAIKDIIEQAEKKYGKGALMRYGDTPQADRDIKVVSTSIPSLDRILGIGGLPKGRVVEIYGPEAGGKTTLTLQVLAEAQRNGDQVAFIDAEHALDPAYASKLGVDMDNVLLSQPDSGNQAFEILELIVKSNEIGVVVIDSVAALVPIQILNGEAGDAYIGIHAKLMSQALAKLVAVIGNSNCCVIFINQLRNKIGVMYGSPETTPGGKALAYYSSVRLDVRRVTQIKKGEEVIGNKTRIKTAKNRHAPPYKSVEIDLIFGEGFSSESDLVDEAIRYGVILKKGGWFKYGDTNIAQGKENLRLLLKEDEGLFERVRLDIENEKLEVEKAESASA
jgi:recombination protein RecA